MSEANINEVLGRTQREDRDELTRLRADLLALRETVRVLGEECRKYNELVGPTVRKTADGKHYFRLPGDVWLGLWYEELLAVIANRNANPGARAAVESNQ